MRTVAFMNNKGGVGKTTLVYHVAHAFADLGVRVLLADLDPQANLSAVCVDEERLEELWSLPAERRETVFGAVYPIKEELGDLRPTHVENISSKVSLLVGDIELSTYEAKLAEAWPACLDRRAPAFRATTAFSRLITKAAESVGAAIALLDVGPNLGAINRSALLAADSIVTPLNADLFSIQGLRNLGPTLADWREEWAKRVSENPDRSLPLPPATLAGAGYCVMQPNLYKGSVTRAYQRWINQIPAEYAQAMRAEAPVSNDVAKDPRCLGIVKHYRSLMPLAQEARKPVFRLTAADGALGSHATASQDAGREFRELARKLANAIGEPLPRIG